MRTQYINAPITEPASTQTQTSNQPEAGTPSHSQTHRLHIEPTLVIGSAHHRSLWEQGQIDYTGRDSFANIQAHLDAKINSKK